MKYHFRYIKRNNKSAIFEARLKRRVYYVPKLSKTVV